MDQEQMASLTDDEVIAWAKTANEDCIEAGNTERDSDWHAACFAACVVFSQEMARRGINMQTASRL
jgi:hypothetical protein